MQNSIRAKILNVVWNNYNAVHAFFNIAIRILTFSFFILASFLLISGNAFSKAPPKSFADLAQKLLPAVVNISTTQLVRRGGKPVQRPQLPPGSPFEEFFKEFFDRQPQRNSPSKRATSLGSGFIIDSTGLIVTNNHVIKGADQISVILHDNTRLKATVVGRDSKTDLAVLRVKSKTKLPFVKFGNSDESRVGDWVVAIGNPFGLGGTVTAGIISARARNINSGPYDDFIQSDASINKGNSGGPMFNTEGKVIGINTAIYSPSGGSVGIGFAIPSNLAEPIISQLKRFGRARRGWLGVRIQTVTKEIADSLGLKETKGALVADVTVGGPADKSRIMVGDIILKFNGKTIDEMRSLPRFVAETAVGKVVKVEVWRKGRIRVIYSRLGEFPEAKEPLPVKSGGQKQKKKGMFLEPFGITLAQIDNDLRTRFNLGKELKGVIIIDVKNNGTASEKGVTVGSIIRKIGPEQKLVRSLNDIKKLVDTALNEKRKSLLFLIERGGSSRFVALTLVNDRK